MEWGLLPRHGRASSENSVGHPKRRSPPIRVPIRPPAPDPGLRQQSRDRFIVEVQPVVSADPQRPAELATQHHQRLFQQPLGMEVCQ